MEKINARLLSWASILEEQTREQAELTSRAAVHPPARRADARRAPGQGCDRRLGDPDARRDHPGRRRRRHRLRHDRRPHPVARRPAAVRPARGCARRSSARSRCRRAGTTRQLTATAQERVADARGTRRQGGVRPRPARGALAAAAGLARVGQPLHRGDASTRRTDGLAVPALGLARRRQQDRAAPHQGRAPTCAGSGGSTCRDRDLAYLVEGTDEFWAYIRELRWAQHFALLNREEMMDRVVGVRRRRGPASRSSGGSRSTATTTTPSRRSTSARRCGCPARARSTARDGRAGPDPGLDGHRARTWWRARATRSR